MRRAGSLCLVDLGALLEAATDAVNRTLARLGLSGKGAVTATVALLAEAGTVAAVAVLRAVVQAGTDIACVSRPAGVAVALALDALAVAGAPLTVAGATRSTVDTTPAILTRANTIKALSMLGAVVLAGLLGAIVTLVAFVANALHLSPNRDALTIAGAGRRASGKSAVDSGEPGLAEAGTVVADAVTSAFGIARTEGAVEALEASLALASEVVVAATTALAIVGASTN